MAPLTAGGPSRWTGAAALGTRIVASGVDESNGNQAFSDDLYASDDGGRSWQHIGGTIQQQGFSVGRFVTLGSRLFVVGYPIRQGPRLGGACYNRLAARPDGSASTADQAARTEGACSSRPTLEW